MNRHWTDANEVHITTLCVTGAACDGCAAHIARVLEDINGVVHVDVHRRESEVVVEHLPAFVDAVSIAGAIRNLGYRADVARTVPDVGCSRPATQQAGSSSCRCCLRPTSTAHWANVGTSTIG